MRSGILLAVVLGGTSGVVAETYHVPGDYPTIQAAILAALEGDEIVVAPGTYNEAIFFNGHNITLRSESGAEVTTIDATGLNNSVVRVILEETIILEGFTITGGDVGNGGAGGGIRCQPCRITIIDCIIKNNVAGYGGGLSGGGSFSRIIVFDSSFIENHASQLGGGIRTSLTGTGFIELHRCLIQGNTVGWQGGGLYLLSNFITLENCAILGNEGLPPIGGAGGMQILGGTLSIANCTIAGNSAVFVGGAYISGSGVVSNIIMWDNGLDPFFEDGDFDLAYSNIELGWPGCDFCILADPQFVDPAKGDYRLAAGSPCIDLGNNAAVPKGVDTDLDGQPRFVDDPDTPDCPQPGADCGSAPIVDMGAYEFQPLLCPWDLDGSGEVGVKDLLILLGNWGNPYGVKDLLALLGNWGPCP